MQHIPHLYKRLEELCREQSVKEHLVDKVNLNEWVNLQHIPPQFFSSFATLTELIEVKIKWRQSADILKTTNIKEEKGGIQKGTY